MWARKGKVKPPNQIMAAGGTTKAIALTYISPSEGVSDCYSLPVLA
ncbi:MAG: hypothetical protein ACQJCO_09490 [cyanobacterium endosymbiont of Rhopalodia sterrenbergii]